MSEKDFFDEDSDDEGASQSETETEEEQDESMAVIASKAKEAKKKVGGVSVMKESSAISAMSSRSKIGDLNMISLDNDNTVRCQP